MISKDHIKVPKEAPRKASKGESIKFRLELPSNQVTIKCIKKCNSKICVHNKNSESYMLGINSHNNRVKIIFTNTPNVR